MEHQGTYDHYRKQDNMLPTIKLVFFPLAALFFLGMGLLFRFLRSLLCGHSESLVRGRLFASTLIVQLLLMLWWIYLQNFHPYRLQEWWGFLGHGHGNDLVVNPLIHGVELSVFLLICLTSFEHRPLVLKQVVGRLALFSLVAVVIIAVGFSVILTGLLRPVSVDQDSYKETVRTTDVMIHFMTMLSAVFFLFLVTDFRAGSDEWNRFGWITFIPIFFFFAFNSWCQLKYIYLSKEVYWDHFDKLGGNG
jgi:hypothetical protein